MTIAFLSVSDQLGGSELALLELLRALRLRHAAWELHLIVPGRGPLHQRASVLGVRCTVVEPPASLARVGESGALQRRWSAAATFALGARLCAVAAAWPAYVRRLRRTLESIRPDVLHTNGLKAHVAGARAVPAGTALIWHLHEYVGRRRLTAALLRRNVAACAAIVANSESVARDVTAAVEPRVAVRVVHNAVDLDRFSPSGMRAELDALANLAEPPERTVRVGLVAVFSRWKGHEVFLQALAALAPNVPVRGYVIGGPLYDTVGSQYTLDELRKMAKDLRVSVGFTGFIDGAAAMRALDVVVHASTEPEPFGLVIAEAMACGRALITSGSGGAAELIEPGVDAMVHPPGDVPALAAAITSFARDGRLRQQYGERARDSALCRFDSRRLAAAMDGIYEEAAATSRPIRKTA